MLPPGSATLYYSAGTSVYHASVEGSGGGGNYVGQEESGVPVAVAVDSTRAAFTTKDGNVDVVPLQTGGQLVWCAADASAASNRFCVRVATGQTHLLLDDITLVDDLVYWANGPSIFRAPSNTPGATPALVATTAHGGDVTFVLRGGLVGSFWLRSGSA